MKLRAGQTLHSAVDTTTVVVIRAPDDDVTVTCGDAEMLESAPASPPEGAAAGDGTQLGKRYVDEAGTIELLCTKAGSSPLAVGGVPLGLKEAKPLPASD